jgi:hypothetical protein
MPKIKNTKVIKKPNGDTLFVPEFDTDTLESGTIYMFHNKVWNINLKIQAVGLDQAMQKFDLWSKNRMGNLS